jgi:isopentenyl diphosphate isomerase/L-lactate dehydrogenase-like FMN-dependent dehydrogenase
VTAVRRLRSADDFERAARRRLPRAVFDLIAGGAADETTLRRNRSAFHRFTLRPRALVDVSQRETSTTVLGHRVSMPLLLGPAGYARAAHPGAELAVARAAGRAGTVYALSTASSYALEDVAAAASGPTWFQLYLRPSQDATEALVDRAEKAGFPVLCATIDTAVRGLRERDTRNGLTIPFRMTPRLVAQAALRPAWTFDFVRQGAMKGAETLGEVGRCVTLADLHWLRDRWRGPLVVKGILRAEECRKVLDCGVDGIVVSNHGGRQLDCTPATLDVLPEVVKAVAGRAEIFVDGGFRRGTDVVKALALGARACLVGRPYLYGLAVGGEEGVARLLEILRHEIDQTMALLGCPSVASIDSDVLRSEAAVAQPDLPERSRGSPRYGRI